jgi:hypothetical protein
MFEFAKTRRVFNAFHTSSSGFSAHETPCECFSHRAQRLQADVEDLVGDLYDAYMDMGSAHNDLMDAVTLILEKNPRKRAMRRQLEDAVAKAKNAHHAARSVEAFQ